MYLLWFVAADFYKAGNRNMPPKRVTCCYTSAAQQQLHLQRLPVHELNTLEKLDLCMRYETPELIMQEDLRLAPLKPIERMLDISKAAGLLGG